MQVQLFDVGLRMSMPNPSNRLFCRLDGLTPALREQKRVSIAKNIGLLEAETIPVFDEATQTAARYLEVPICFLSLMVHEQIWLKSAIGLSQLGLMNPLASSRRIPRQEAFCTYVVDSHQPVVIGDTLNDPFFSRSILAQHYGIRAYLGCPLITADGWCIGTIAAMDLIPRQFSQRDVEFLSLVARWCLREYERDHLLKSNSADKNEWVVLNQERENSQLDYFNSETKTQTTAKSISSIKVQLLKQLAQELRSPLTSVIGMASVLLGEVFGHISTKQKEYLDIIHNSGQQMNSLVDEIVRLGGSEDSLSQLNINPVNIEMLCQQVLNDLRKIAKQKHQELRLSVEPGQRIWLLDRDKVQQAIYYLMISVLESAESGGEVRLHVSRKNKTLNLAVWMSHPWLADGLPQVRLVAEPIKNSLILEPETLTDRNQLSILDSQMESRMVSSSSLENALKGVKDFNPKSPDSNPQELLGLLLACYLTESHGGKITIQGSLESGYRYVMMLPKMAAEPI